MTERFGDGPSTASSRLRTCARCSPSAAGPSARVGVAGTVTTIAALDLGLARTTRSGFTATGSRARRRANSSDRLAALPRRRARALPDHRAGARAGDRRRRRDPVARSLDFYGLDGIDGERARHPPRRRARRGRAARARRRRRAARRLHLLLTVGRLARPVARRALSHRRATTKQSTLRSGFLPTSRSTRSGSWPFSRRHDGEEAEED